MNLTRADEVGTAFEMLRPAGERVLIERMLPTGVELILGALVMVGSGGVVAEVVDDVALAPAPLDEAAARGLIERTRAGRVMRGYRGQGPVDIASAAAALARLSQLRCDCDGPIAEIDVNPLIVTTDGAFVADALVRATPSLIGGTTPE